ncbi:MAG: hypothetical protein GX430_06775 [Treponema sp.]|nr:hypothetical protein [Treponema sp.]
MKKERVSKITCIAASSLRSSILSALEDSGLRDTFVQRGKQVSLADRAGMFRLVPRVELEDSAADIYRFYAPPDRAEEICARISDFAGLALPGRGSLFVEPAEIVRGASVGAAPPDPESGEEPGSGKGTLSDRLRLPSGLQDYTALTCIVQRGQGDALARTVLEMGLCVPVVTYGQGMGLRNKLGLLRITIPVDKEVIYFLVPAADGPLAENIAVHKARLDRPGQGFIYRCRVRAAAVNTRMSRSRRRHVASMEQVILSVDSLQGSTDWRRITAPSRGRGGQIDEGPALACLSVICDEGRAGDFVRAAMEAGAGGATLMRLGYRDLPGAAAEHRGRSPSHARETCDLIVPADLIDDILEALADRGLFEPEVYGLVEITKVEKAVTYRG